MIAETTFESNRTNKKDGTYLRTTKMITHALFMRRMNYREICDATGLSQNQVAGRINELVKKGFVRACGIDNSEKGHPKKIYELT